MIDKGQWREFGQDNFTLLLISKTLITKKLWDKQIQIQSLFEKKGKSEMRVQYFYFQYLFPTF